MTLRNVDNIVLSLVAGVSRLTSGTCQMILRFWLFFDLYVLAGRGRVGMKCERDKKGLRRFTAIPSYYWYAWQDSNLRPAD
jgi:hypothetical protein